MKEKIRSTTILCVRRNGKVVMAGDGQVTLGQEVLKSSARKLRRLYSDKILAGFAGSTADAFALFSRFESKLEQHNGNLPRSVEVAAIGSGGPFATAAATALVENTKLGAKEIAEKSMKVAGEICIYTNQSITFEELG